MSLLLIDKRDLRVKAVEDPFLSSHILLFFLGHICQLNAQPFPADFSFVLKNDRYFSCVFFGHNNLTSTRSPPVLHK